MVTPQLCRGSWCSFLSVGTSLALWSVPREGGVEGVLVFLFFFELFMYFARCVLLLAVVVNWLLMVYGNCGVSVPRCDSNFTSSANIRSQSHIVMASSKVSFFCFVFPSVLPSRYMQKQENAHTSQGVAPPSGERRGGRDTGSAAS